MDHVLGQGEYAEVDGHTPGGHVLAVGRVCFMEAQDDVSLDSEINGGLDEDGEEIESTC